MPRTAVSVVMSVRNAAPYLHDCLDSILQQTFSDWELVVVDNASTDESGAILKTCAERDARIKLHQNASGDLIDALRVAYTNSSGAFITRMDADDRMAPQKLEKLHNALQEAHVPSIATGLVQYFSDGELGNGFQQYEAWLNGLTKQNANWSEIWKECSIASPCWMVTREALEQAGGYQRASYPEDYDLCFRFWELGLKVAGVPEVLHHWRDYSDRTSRTDSRYANNGFFALKATYWQRNCHNPNVPTVLWGAGKKGKALARELQRLETDFQWVCDNPQKIGKDIFGVRMEHFKVLESLERPQIIVAVSGPEDQQAVRDYLQKIRPGNEPKSEATPYFFC